MISRVRKAWRVIVLSTVLSAAWVGRIFDKEDALTLIGLALVGAGFRLWSPALALIVPGVILLWIFLPSRPPFVEVPPTRPRRIQP